MISAAAWPLPARKAGHDRMVEHSILEREVKLAVDSLEPVEARLRALEGDLARFVDAVQERNYVLDTAREELKARDERLRIRTVEGRPGVRVTWKGPASVREGVRRREEREFEADDYESCVAVLSNLGLRPVRSYHKARSSWFLGEVIICLDTLPFGAFVEIEFTAKVAEKDEVKALRHTLALLGLQNAPRVQASYARLQQEWLATRQGRARNERKERR